MEGMIYKKIHVIIPGWEMRGVSYAIQIGLVLHSDNLRTAESHCVGICFTGLCCVVISASHLRGSGAIFGFEPNLLT